MNFPFFRRFLGVTALALSTALPNTGFAAGAESKPVQKPVPFEIGPASLSAALEAFSKASGIQIFADGDLLENKVSNGVRGVLSPRVALGVLLAPAGLGFEELAPNTVSVVPVPPKADYRVYYRAIQTRFLKVLCSRSELTAGLDRILMRASVSEEGTVHNVIVLNITPENAKGGALAEAIDGLKLPPPPPGMPQPVTMVLKPAMISIGSSCRADE